MLGRVVGAWACVFLLVGGVGAQPPGAGGVASEGDEAPVEGAETADGSGEDAESSPTGEDAAAADEAPAPPTERPRPLAITISAAASMGAYEAGYLHYLVEALRPAREQVELRALVGTSAGCINALLGALATCAEPTPAPTESLFWQSWMPIGADRLHDPEQVDGIHVFTRDQFDVATAAVERRFRGGLEPGCEVLVGASVTRVRPETLPGGDLLAMPRMTERFLLRVTGRGANRTPAVANHRPPHLRALALPRLAVDGPTADPFGALRKLVYASSAFHGGFAPQALRYCPGTDEADAPCTPEEARVAPFLDGGVFDSHPVGLATWALRDGGADALPEDALLLLVNPVLRSYPAPLEGPLAQDGANGPGGEGPELPDTMLPYAAAVLEGFGYSAMTIGLQEALAHEPALRERLFMSRLDQPPASDPLSMFLGFFEERFRRYDFYLGMVHARRALDTARGHEAVHGDLDAAVPLEERVDVSGPGWRPYHCLRAIFDGVGDADALCAGDALAPYRALAATSRDRIYDACQPERVGSDPARRRLAERHPDCARALRGEAPPDAGARWARGEDEAELAWIFRRMGHHGLRFPDLGVDEPDGEAAYVAFRHRIAAMATDLAGEQGLLTPLARVIAQTTADELAYVPERHDLYLQLGGVVGELGWSFTGRGVPRLRGTFALEARGTASLLSAEPSWIGVAPLLGFEVELGAPLNGALQLRTGLRGGYVFSSRDDFGGGECADPQDRSRPCSRAVFQATATAIAAHLVRVALVAEWVPPFRDDERALWSVRPEIGVQYFWD